MNTIYDIGKIRAEFPALAVTDNGQRRVYLDNPAGTQVPQQVLNRIQDYLINWNANHGGHFTTAIASDAILHEAHQAMADLLNAASPDEIVFGQNMTSLTFAISRSIVKRLPAGKSILLTRMDHDANVSPWVMAAKDNDVEIRWLPFNTETYEFDAEEIERCIDDSVGLVAVCYASNALGTINNIEFICQAARSVGALTYIDAVQMVPHAVVDVQALGCDFLACSAYKFFGPHQGILWGKLALLEELEAYKVRPAEDDSPGKWETGTQSHEGQAGTLGALEYLQSIGRVADNGKLDRKAELRNAMSIIQAYEAELSKHLIAGLLSMPYVTVHGITARASVNRRVPTVAFTDARKSPEEIAKGLADRNVFVWDGDYYAVEVVSHLGLTDSGGMVRVGPVHYNTIDELDIFLNAVEDICG